jgi:indole-3-glycerol phosphate synthase
MTNKLDEIMARKRAEVRDRQRPVREAELARFRSGEAGRLARALRSSETLGVVAEIKRKSPSAGVLSDSLDAVEQARLYVNGEADGLSVLTDEPFFGGKLSDLWEITDFLRVHRRDTPCLRKDFFVDPIQVLEAAEAGASAILIIVRALSRDERKRLREAADTAGLDALYEVHDERELEAALADDPELVGVNNRDLARFVTDLSVSERLIPGIPDSIATVCESGILAPADAARAREAGADAILVGESLVRSKDPAALIRSFKEA